MRIIGCDLHASQQTIAMLDDETGDIVERTLKHEGATVREFYAALPRPVLVGIEATGSMGWFLRLMEELGITCHVGHPATIRRAEIRRQKHDRRDAALLLDLLTQNRFPSIWMPSTELGDVRALLLHRHQWVRIRTRVMNALQGIALAHGIRRGAGLWSRDGQATIASLRLPPHASHRRAELQALYVHLNKQIDELDQRVSMQARERPQAARLMTHPGVGPVTALATEVFLGDPSRFADGKAVASYVGLIPSEYSSGERQRLGNITKQGNPLLRLLWCEAAIHAVRRDPTLQRFYRRKLQHKGFGKARVAARANWAFVCGFCYAIRLTTRSSAVARHCERRSGEACMRECLRGEMVRLDGTGNMFRLPASLSGSSHESSWSLVTEEMFGGQHRS